MLDTQCLYLAESRTAADERHIVVHHASLQVATALSILVMRHMYKKPHEKERSIS